MEKTKRLLTHLRNPKWLIMGAFLLFFFAIVGQSAKLTCERTHSNRAVNCLKEAHFFWVISLGTTSIADVQEARLVGGYDDDYGATYRVELLAGQGVIPLNSVYTSGFGTKDDIVNQINDYVQNPTEDSLVVTDPGLLNFENFVWAAIGLMVWVFWKWIKSESGREQDNSIRSAVDINKR